MPDQQLEPSCHFTYSPQLDKTSLMQGDVLARTPEIDQLLAEVHPHFHRKASNKYFMVVTQSCDLVPGRKGAFCKAPYISIAPVRPLSEIVAKQISNLAEGDVKSELPLLSSRAKQNLLMFLQRLFNNNEPGLFFLESRGTPLTESCCALLSLTIAIKAPLHYQKCLEAKLLELDQAFQAKLGWLVGQMYSRVGTTDWTTAEVNSMSMAAIKDGAIWVPEDKIKAVLSSLQAGDTDGVVTAKKVADTLKNIPSQKDKVFERLATVVNEAIPIEQAAIGSKVLKRLKNDTVLASLLNKN